jgi:hypothetical protein
MTEPERSPVRKNDPIVTMTMQYVLSGETVRQIEEMRRAEESPGAFVERLVKEESARRAASAKPIEDGVAVEF